MKLLKNVCHSRPRLEHSRAGCGGNPVERSILGNATLADILKRSNEYVAALDARLLMQHVLKISHAQLVTHPECALTVEQQARFESLLDRRTNGEPVAYLIGEREFFGLSFEVTPDVLIPRPETELLVELALARLPDDAPCSVLDLGTGSGAIAITLAAHRPLAHVLAVDASQEALLVARSNSRRLLAVTPTPGSSPGQAPTLPRQGGGDASRVNGAEVQNPPLFLPATVTPSFSLPLGAGLQEPLLTAGDADEFSARPSKLSSFFSLPPRGEKRRRPRGGGELGWGKIAFARSDWFSAVGNRRFDLIVANPPYVAADDAHLDEGDVRFEPRMALVGGEDGLQCIRHIVARARAHLKPGGWLLFEHGYDQADACRELLQAAGYIDILSRRDLAGIPRVAGGRSPT